MVLLGFVTGCSLSFARAPEQPTSIESCPRLGLPVIDAVVGTGLGIAALATLTAPALNNNTENGTDDLNAVVASVAFLIAATYALSATYGYWTRRDCSAGVESSARLAKERDAQDQAFARRQGAWSVTKQAAAAARAGDCASVNAADAQVRELDADFHATVFVRDVAIARCLGARASQ
jgi:hypothetical protein